ncbi:DedA family protein [Planococcus sp. YIM B11945]|uniref:DedA family protein n=1 Tax=Planococcus sp. YIM B11945 TaxID=3435410 RepID=UPI003D7CCA17
MLEAILGFLESIGLIGLFAVIFIEGSSLPFPGVLVVLAYGGLLKMDFLDTALVSAGMAAFYSLASLLPYYLGDKMGQRLHKKFQNGINRAAKLFRRYGIWSIALSRPFGIGNYISYMAGMSRVGIRTYLALTFSGIFPWCFAILWLGNYFNGNYEAFQAFYHEFHFIVYSAVAFLVAVFIVFSSRKQLVRSK